MFLDDVRAVILVSHSDETKAMLMCETDPVRVLSSEGFDCCNTFLWLVATCSQLNVAIFRDPVLRCWKIYYVLVEKFTK